MKKIRTFISYYKSKLLGFFIYYVLFAVFAFAGTIRGWPMILLNVLLLLFLISLSVGFTDDHYANFHAFRQQPFVAQDLIPSFNDFDGLDLFTALFLNFPPVFYLIGRLLFHFIL